LYTILQLAQSSPRAEGLEGFKGGAHAVRHDVHVVLPVEPKVEVDAEVARGVRGVYPVLEGPGGVRKPNVGWCGRAACEFWKKITSVLSGSMARPAQCSQSQQSL